MKKILALILSLQIVFLPACGTSGDTDESSSEVKWDGDSPDTDKPIPGDSDILKDPAKGETTKAKDPPQDTGYCLLNCADVGDIDDKTGIEVDDVKDSDSGDYAGVVSVSPESGTEEKEGVVFTTNEYGAELLKQLGASNSEISDALDGKTVVTGKVVCKEDDGNWHLDPSTIASEPWDSPDPTRAPVLSGTGKNDTPAEAGTVGQVSNHRPGTEQPSNTSQVPASSRGKNSSGESLFPDTGNIPSSNDTGPGDDRPRGLPGNGNVPEKADPANVVQDKIKENAGFQAAHINQELSDTTAKARAGRTAIESIEKSIRESHNRAVVTVSDAAGFPGGLDGAPVDHLPEPKAPADSPIKTPKDSPHYSDLQSAYDYLAYVTDEVAKDQSSNRPAREAAVGVAGLGIDLADQSFDDGDAEAGNEILKNSLMVLDLALDFVPGASLAKDVISLATGKNPVTGDELSDVEMAMTVSMMFMPSVLSGVAKTTTKIGTRIVQVAKKNKLAAKVVEDTNFPKLDEIIDAAKKNGIKEADEIKAYGKIHDAVKGLPGKLQPKRIRPGSNDKIAIIGRNMGNPDNGTVGVKTVAEHMKKNGYDGKVNIFDGDEIGTDAAKQWDEMTANGRRLTDEEIRGTLMYKRNREWAQRKVDDGSTIIDIGNPNGQPNDGPFYKMEKEMIFGDR